MSLLYVYILIAATNVKKSFAAALPSIIETFEQWPAKVFSVKDIERIRSMWADDWHLPPSTAKSRFLNQMLLHTCLERFELAFPTQRKIAYTWGAVPLLAKISSVWTSGYLSHSTAAYINGMVDELPRDIYVNVEQPNSSPDGSDLSQERIDSAYRKLQRMPTRTAEHEGHAIHLTNGRNTFGIGVISSACPGLPTTIRTTTLERTLIDLVVRPAYVGGPEAVLRIFQRALPKLDIPLLFELLKSLKFVYPYEQPIGFYLQQAGISDETLALAGTPPFKFDFYLAHGMASTRYVERWGLHAPLSV